jgi:hypothetical protein
MKIFVTLMLSCLALGMQAARVDTVMVKSPSMDKDVKVVFVVSDKALTKQATQRLTFIFNCNSLTNGCNPKNITKGNKSKNLLAPKIKDNIQVAK